MHLLQQDSKGTFNAFIDRRKTLNLSIQKESVNVRSTFPMVLSTKCLSGEKSDCTKETITSRKDGGGGKEQLSLLNMKKKPPEMTG